MFTFQASFGPWRPVEKENKPGTTTGDGVSGAANGEGGSAGASCGGATGQSGDIIEPGSPTYTPPSFARRKTIPSKIIVVSISFIFCIKENDYI